MLRHLSVWSSRSSVFCCHQVTGSPIPDALGSIFVGILLGVIAIILIDRNRRFLVGEEASPTLRAAAVEALTQLPEINRITFLRMEYLGPRQVYLVASVDLVGDYAESRVAHTLRELERSLEQSPRVVRAILTLSTPRRTVDRSLNFRPGDRLVRCAH